MVRSALGLERTDLGFEPKGLHTFTLGLTSKTAGDEPRRITFFRELVRHTAALPSVEAAGLARAAPFSTRLTPRAVQVAGSFPPTLPDVVPQVASPGFADVLRFRPIAGRWFSSDDGPGAGLVAVVSESLARRAWRAGEAVGRRLRFPSWNMASMTEEPGPWLEVVGVVPDMVTGVHSPTETVYVAHAQAPIAWMDLVVRVRPGTSLSTRDLQAVVRELDPAVPLYSAASVEAAVDGARAPSRFFTALMSGFSLFSFGLALIGIYGVAAYAARQQRRVVAIRMALGASRRGVQRLFVRRALGTLAIGLLVGLWAGRLLGQTLQGRVYGLESQGIFLALAVAALLAGTALLAVWVPARQAASLDPMSVLREE
jgi:hypothetical protein